MAVPRHRLAEFGFPSPGEPLRVDEQGRLPLGSAALDAEYRAYVNAAGQILLDPVGGRDPALWLWESPALKRAIEEALRRAGEADGA